jgi:ABC-type antimicrobial peptide transport system permease subunit
VIGVPIGVAVGRLAWRAFASRLGVVTEPSMPVGWLVATALGAVLIAVIAAALPARAAAQSNPQALLLATSS